MRRLSELLLLNSGKRHSLKYYIRLIQHTFKLMLLVLPHLFRIVLNVNVRSLPYNMLCGPAL